MRLWIVPHVSFKEMSHVLADLYKFSRRRFWFVMTLPIKSITERVMLMCRNKKQITHGESLVVHCADVRKAKSRS